jgi:hypothetical protein
VTPPLSQWIVKSPTFSDSFMSYSSFVRTILFYQNLWTTYTDKHGLGVKRWGQRDRFDDVTTFRYNP